MRHVSFPNRRSPCRSRKPRLVRSPHRLPSSRPAPRSPARRCSTCRCSDSVPLLLRARHRLTSARSRTRSRSRRSRSSELALSPTSSTDRRPAAPHRCLRLPPATSRNPSHPRCRRSPRPPDRRHRNRRWPRTTTAQNATADRESGPALGHPRPCRPGARGVINERRQPRARGPAAAPQGCRITRRGHRPQRGRRAGRHRCNRCAFAALDIDDAPLGASCACNHAADSNAFGDDTDHDRVAGRTPRRCRH